MAVGTWPFFKSSFSLYGTALTPTLPLLNVTAIQKNIFFAASLLKCIILPSVLRKDSKDVNLGPSFFFT